MMPAFKLRYGKYCGRKIDFGRKIAAIDEVSSCVSSSSSVVSSGKKEALVPDLKTKPLISSASMRHRAEEIMRLLSNDCASEVRIRQLLGDSPDTSKALRIWPTCDCLIAFYSSGYPLKKAEAYAALRKPFLVNELGPQRLLHDRRKVYEFYLIQCTFHDGHIDMLSSDHSPTVPELKRFNDGNFLKAWGGISSLQFVLPVTWSYGRKYGMTLEQLASWWSEKPAKLAGLNLKGAIAIGNHADIVVWEPEVEFDLNDSHPTYVKHPIPECRLETSPSP